MENILSFSPGTRIKGSMIKEWILYHTTNETSLSKEARKMTQYLNIDDDSDYFVYRGKYQASERKFCVIKALD